MTVYSGKVELGTGVRTGFTQIVADELDVPMANVNVIQGDTALTPTRVRPMAACRSEIGGVQIRQAAATARMALLDRSRSDALERRKKISSSRMELSRAKSGGDRDHLCADLIGGKNFYAQGRPGGSHEKPCRLQDRGQADWRLDIPGKLTGQFTYMQDFRVPGMLHGRVVRPPAIGAKLESVDESSIKDIPGHRQSGAPRELPWRRRAK